MRSCSQFLRLYAQKWGCWVMRDCCERQSHVCSFSTQLIHFWRASLIAQSVKNLPAMQETQVRFLGGEDPLEKEMAMSSQYSHLGKPVDRGAWWAAVHGIARVGQDLATKPSPSTFGQTLGLERIVPSWRESGTIALCHMAPGRPLLRGGVRPF